jgi:lipopolysaccharide assembly outer membrane protein LptD (OstA)
MRRLLLIACFAAPAIGQTGRPIPKDEILIKAIRQEELGGVAQDVTRLSGAVEIETAVLILRADEADFNPNTKEIRPRGNVLVKLK